MSYRFKLCEPVAAGVRRIAAEQFDMAEGRLASANDMALAIHDVRRCLKRLRALLRLIRPALPKGDYARETERLSGIGRLLAGARDLEVIGQTLAKLRNRGNGLSKDTADALQSLLAANRARNGADPRKEALARLKAARRVLTGAAIAGVTFHDLVAGLEKSYAQARRRLRRARDAPSDERLHAWRKAVQWHWRHVQLLSHGWPEAMSAHAGEAKELSRLLGEDHDYAVLLAFARRQGRGVMARKELHSLAALCKSAQAELRAAAAPRGQRLFAETAESLTARVDRYWNSAVSLACLAAPAPAAPPRGERPRRPPPKRPARIAAAQRR